MLLNDTLLFLLIAHFFDSHDAGDPVPVPWDRLIPTQVLIGVAIRGLAAGVQDAGLRRQLQVAADEVIVKNSRGGEEPSELGAMSAVSA